MNQPVQRVPWYLWCAALAVTSAYVGGYWDISWHRSIGRDSFWSAPHIAIYACGVLAGISSTYLIFMSTFRSTNAVRPFSSSARDRFTRATADAPKREEREGGQGRVGGAESPALRDTGVRIWGLSGPI